MLVNSQSYKQNKMGNKINLDNKQQLVVNISAFTAVGNMDSLTI